MSTAWSPIRSTHRRDHEHAQRVLALLRGVAEGEEIVGGIPVRAVDQLVQLDQGLGLLGVAGRERVHRDPDHLLRTLAHVLDRPTDRLVVDVQVAHQLRELRDRDAVVGHPLEMEVDPEHREHEAEIDGDGRLARQQRLDASLDLDVPPVDLVVEGDHLVRELRVASGKCVECRSESTKDEIALLLEAGLELRQLFGEGDPHPKRPVT